MHRILLTTAICIACLNSFGQQITQDRDDKKVEQYLENARKAVDNKQYSQACDILEEASDYLTGTPYRVNWTFVDQLAQVRYQQAVCFALAKKEYEGANAFSQAVGLGWNDYNQAKREEAFKRLRKERAFLYAMQSLRQKYDYLGTLQHSAPYVPSDSSMHSLHFTYAEATDSNLVRVREYFNLDSIAGNGDEISQIKNLLAWVHDNVRHDGSYYYDGQPNAIDIVNFHRRTKKGMNCRMLATVLNECYLAMGFKSRFVTCMPEIYVSDCHVINAVWSETLHKWLWMDPTQNAWVMDEKGHLLSIAEVRERLREGKPVTLNEEANWNHERKTTAESYLYSYMAKNLYYVVCRLRYEFNTESNQGGKKVSPPVALIAYGYRGADNYSTTFNDEWFWQEP